MSQRNLKAVPNPLDKTHEGTPAKHLSAMEELRRTVMACLLWEDQFYESGEGLAERVAELVNQINGADVAELAIEAREKMKLRHMPLYLARLLAAKGYNVEDLLYRIIQRPDELTEFLALYGRKDRKPPLAASVKRGLARAFTKFNAYSLAKYNRATEIKLRDVLFLCHAKPKDDEQAATWKLLVENNLPTPDTWETELSAGKDKRATWERLIIENKLGALALLRNLRNMESVSVNRDLIKTALKNMPVERVLPFRFISAARYAPSLESDIEQAMFRCLEGIPKLPGKTALVIDTSPSMWGTKVSDRSEMDRFEAAAALAILCRELCSDVRIYAFNSESYDIPDRRGFGLRDALATSKGSHSRGGLAVAKANKDGYDRIVVLTDGQWHYSSMSGGEKFGEAVVASPAPLTKCAYMINVAGYKRAVGYGKWTQIDGWSESVMSYIAANEFGANANVGEVYDENTD